MIINSMFYIYIIYIDNTNNIKNINIYVFF